jgi:hypothetical protein
MEDGKRAQSKKNRAFISFPLFLPKCPDSRSRPPTFLVEGSRTSQQSNVVSDQVRQRHKPELRMETYLPLAVVDCFFLGLLNPPPFVRTRLSAIRSCFFPLSPPHFTITHHSQMPNTLLQFIKFINHSTQPRPVTNTQKRPTRQNRKFARHFRKLLSKESCNS